MASNLQIIARLEELTEIQAKVISVLACSLAELGDTETGRDEIAEADRKFREIIGEDENGVYGGHEYERRNQPRRARGV